MAIIQNLDYSETEAAPAKPKRVKKAAPAAAPEPQKPQRHGRGGLLAGLLVVGILVVGVFGYTQVKLNSVENGTDDKAATLEAQLKALKNELLNLTEKTTSLEKLGLQNKEVVIDLFDRNRTIPTDVKTEGWQKYTNDQLGYFFSYPTTWEVVVPNTEIFVKPTDAGTGDQVPAAGENPTSATTSPTTTETKPIAAPVAPTTTPAPTTTKPTTTPTEVVPALPVEIIVYAQPKGKTEFAKLVSIKNVYPDFIKLPLAQKYDLFKGLKLLDERDFAHGKMLYFLDGGDTKDQVVPTILILTETNIFRATFTMTDKKNDQYITLRQEFENILSTFDVVPPPAPVDPKKR